MCKNPCKTRRLFRVRHPPPKDKSWANNKILPQGTVEIYRVFIFAKRRPQ